MQLALTVALTVADRPSWGFLFSYCAACVALVAPSPYGFTAVLAYSAAAVAATAIAGADPGTAFGFWRQRGRRRSAPLAHA